MIGQALGNANLKLQIQAAAEARQRPLRRLDRSLFIDAEHNSFLGRGNIETDNVRSLRRELGIVALAPGLAGGKVGLVLGQEAPDILNVNVLQRLGSQRTRPPSVAFGRGLIQKRQNALVRRLSVERLPARPRTVLTPAKTVIGKAPPPVADNPRLNPYFLRNGTCAAPFRRQQYDPRPLDVALRRRTRPAPSLKYLGYLRLQTNFSCFRYHPHLESRISYEEKGLLDRFL